MKLKKLLVRSSWSPPHALLLTGPSTTCAIVKAREQRSFSATTPSQADFAHAVLLTLPVLVTISCVVVCKKTTKLTYGILACWGVNQEHL